MKANHKENGAELQSWWCQNLAESGHPVFRSTSPLTRGVPKSKGGGKLSIHFCADEGTIETVFCTLISVNLLSIYGAVPDLCEEYNSCHVRTGRPVLVGQSDPLFVPKNSFIHLRPMILRKKIYCKSTKNEWTSCRDLIEFMMRFSTNAVLFHYHRREGVCLGCERDILQHCAECEIVCGVLETLCYIAFEYDTELTSTREKNIAILLRLWQFPLHHRPMNFSLPQKSFIRLCTTRRWHCTTVPLKKRVDKLSQQNRVIKFCIDAGFLTTVDVGQFFMTKDTEEFSQFTESVVCRGYTLPRDERIIWSERLDSRRHPNWARIGSHNQLLTR